MVDSLQGWKSRKATVVSRGPSSGAAFAVYRPPEPRERDLFLQRGGQATSCSAASSARCLITAPCPNQAESRRLLGERARRSWSTYSVTALSSPNAVSLADSSEAPIALPWNRLRTASLAASAAVSE